MPSLMTRPLGDLGVIVAASALLTFAFAVRTARGSRRAYLRLRIASAIMLAAIVVIIAIPGSFRSG